MFFSQSLMSQQLITLTILTQDKSLVCDYPVKHHLVLQNVTTFLCVFVHPTYIALFKEKSTGIVSVLVSVLSALITTLSLNVNAT